MNFWLKSLAIALLLNYTCFFVHVESINSYIYLSDKTIKEELASNSFVANVAKELEKKQQHIDSSASPMSFTLLDDSKLGESGNELFKLDASSGLLTTKQTLDREHMCSSRQCADACDSPVAGGMCRINLKILVMPSYNILNFNIFVEDINDNPPYFPQANITLYVNENVPMDYKVPINLAYDRDFGSNTIQRYEITKEEAWQSDFDLVKRTFRLAQNLNESQLHLMVASELDREKIASYNFTITAYDGGRPMLSAKLNLNVVIVDINDNTPVFERELYKFAISEDTKVDTMIGQVRAFDLDHGQNGLIKYSFVDNSNRLAHQNANSMMNSNRFVLQKSGGVVMQSNKQQNMLKYFDLNERTGVLRLKQPIDYEDESRFSLVVEARDGGEASLPSYTNIDIDIIDTNDNVPEISVSFLNTLKKEMVSNDNDNDVKYNVYVPEHTKTNKFIAHVSIVDKDTNDNGKVDWMILINEKVFESKFFCYLRPFNFGPGLGNFLMKPGPRIYFSIKNGEGNLAPLGYQKTKFNLALNESKMGLSVSWKRHIPFEG